MAIFHFDTVGVDSAAVAYEWRFLPVASGCRRVATEGCWLFGNTMPIHRGIVSRTGAGGCMNGLVSRSQSVAVLLVLLHPFEKLRFPAPQLLLVDLPDVGLVANGSADHQHSTAGPHIVGVL